MTVYSARREAEFVMTSTAEVELGQEPDYRLADLNGS